MLFRAIAMPSDEAVQYVGIYVLKWGDTARQILGQPTMGFVPIDEDILVEFATLCRRYPNESVTTLLETAMHDQT